MKRKPRPFTNDQAKFILQRILEDAEGHWMDEEHLDIALVTLEAHIREDRRYKFLRMLRERKFRLVIERGEEIAEVIAVYPDGTRINLTRKE